MGNTVMFLQEALRLLTRTLFSFQGTTQLFFLHLQKVETQGLKPRMPNHGLKCRGLRRLKPYSVRWGILDKLLHMSKGLILVNAGVVSRIVGLCVLLIHLLIIWIKRPHYSSPLFFSLNKKQSSYLSIF